MNESEKIHELVIDYMDLLDEILGDDHEMDELIVGIVNETYEILTGDPEPIIRYKVINLDDYEDEELPEDIAEMRDELEQSGGRIHRAFPTEDTSQGQEIPNETLGEELGANAQDALQHVSGVFQDLAYALDTAEDDIERLHQEKQDLKEKNENLLNQARSLYERTGNQAEYIRELQSTIDNIFKEGDQSMKGIQFEPVKGKEDTKLPERSTKSSAGYDFYSNEAVVIPSFWEQEHYTPTIVKTGVKAKFDEDVVLNLYSRSSMSLKHGIVIPNSSGVIESDYYENEDNDGEIMFGFLNMSRVPYTIEKGQRIGQGVFSKFLTVDDDNAEGERKGGIGSTGK